MNKFAMALAHLFGEPKSVEVEPGVYEHTWTAGEPLTLAAVESLIAGQDARRVAARVPLLLVFHDEQDARRAFERAGAAPVMVDSAGACEVVTPDWIIEPELAPKGSPLAIGDAKLAQVARELAARAAETRASAAIVRLGPANDSLALNMRQAFERKRWHDVLIFEAERAHLWHWQNEQRGRGEL